MSIPDRSPVENRRQNPSSDLRDIPPTIPSIHLPLEEPGKLVGEAVGGSVAFDFVEAIEALRGLSELIRFLLENESSQSTRYSLSKTTWASRCCEPDPVVEVAPFLEITLRDAAVDLSDSR